MDIHSCSYYCDRPECIKSQRDQLRDDLEQVKREFAEQVKFGQELHFELCEMKEQLAAERKAVEWAAENMIMRLHGSDDGAWEMLTPKEIRERAR